MKKLTLKTIEKVNKLRALFPHEISVSVRRGDEGKYCAEVTTYSGCFTEGNTFAELIEMVNDVVRMYLDVPEKYFQYMPEYFPPISLAQSFGVFPPTARTIEVDFNIAKNEKVKC
ncbi:MAG: hypothetical protein WC998_04160 [Candidatus Paceibacterota bacterium]|jgi:predicted RNase H-like HicB family nuclease